MIESARFTENGSIFAAIDGTDWTIPDDTTNHHRQKIAEWEAEGNTIDPYEPPAAPLATLSARQFRLGLHANGLLSSVQSGIDAMPEPDKTAAQIEWEYATQIERDHPLVQNLSAQLGLTDEQIDTMWQQAAAL